MADTQNPRTDVAVLGTSIMGLAMARNLVAAGLRTTAWDRSPSAAAPPPLLVALSRQWRVAVDADHGREDVSAARLALDGHQ